MIFLSLIYEKGEWDVKRKHIDVIAETARTQGCSRKQVEDSVLHVWNGMRHNPDPAVREFAQALETDGNPPAPEQILRCLAALITVTDMLPFIRAGYSEADYHRLCHTELASSLRSGYGEGELSRMAMEQVAQLYRVGKL